MGGTGHAESVQCTFLKGVVGYGELVEFFYRTHDPTQAGGQGPDKGNRELGPRPTPSPVGRSSGLFCVVVGRL